MGLEDGHVILLQVLEALTHESTALPGQRRALEAQALRLVLQACGDGGEGGRAEGRRAWVRGERGFGVTFEVNWVLDTQFSGKDLERPSNNIHVSLSLNIMSSLSRGGGPLPTRADGGCLVCEAVEDEAGSTGRKVPGKARDGDALVAPAAGRPN